MVMYRILATVLRMLVMVILVMLISMKNHVSLRPVGMVCTLMDFNDQFRPVSEQ
jgi:hypothetical protein